MNPLEESYFVFEHYADYTADHSALALFQYKNGDLENIINPCDLGIMDEIGEAETQQVINYLLKQNIRKVYSLPTRGLSIKEEPDVLFGQTLHHFEKGVSWYHYDGVYDEHYWCSLFESVGIKLERYDLA
ncbi:hypothetical protein HYX17_01005 [Candidatus Woesearchaeota archaeon]|nr:hypothetical protein [Candidatus Woesearchaeota archaeon]